MDSPSDLIYCRMQYTTRRQGGIQVWLIQTARDRTTKSERPLTLPVLSCSSKKQPVLQGKKEETI